MMKTEVKVAGTNQTHMICEPLAPSIFLRLSRRTRSTGAMKVFEIFEQFLV